MFYYINNLEYQLVKFQIKICKATHDLPFSDTFCVLTTYHQTKVLSQQNSISFTISNDLSCVAVVTFTIIIKLHQCVYCPLLAYFTAADGMVVVVTSYQWSLDPCDNVEGTAMTRFAVWPVSAPDHGCGYRACSKSLLTILMLK